MWRIVLEGVIESLWRTIREQTFTLHMFRPKYPIIGSKVYQRCMRPNIGFRGGV